MIRRNQIIKKIDDFIRETKSKLFDVSFYKCAMMVFCFCGSSYDCKCEVVKECRCDKKNKIPVIEREFMYDQLNSRLKYIGKLGKTETRIITNELKEKITKRV